MSGLPMRFLILALAAAVTAARSGAGESVAQAKQAGESGSLVVAIGGDVLPESTWSAPVDPGRLLVSMRQEFARADLVFVNLEEPITSSDTVTSGKEIGRAHV